MKKLIVCMAVLAMATAANAAEFPLRGPSLFGPSIFLGSQDVPPAPEGVAPKMSPQPMAVHQALFPCVKYKELRNMHPCAVPKIVQVPDPCWKKCKDPCCCSCKPRGCVSIKICVPPCSCCPPKVKCNKDGTKIRYDYGEYAVDIRVRKGYVLVDYDD
jgi:hypothetical protein